MLGGDDPEVKGRCVLAPMPEHETAARLLSEAADALLAGYSGSARFLVEQADIPMLRHFATEVMGGRHPDMRRPRRTASPTFTGVKAPKALDAKTEARVFARDGFRCRYCECRVIPRPVRDRMRAMLPGVIRCCLKKGENAVGPGEHGAFHALTATPDHVVPRAAGGTNDDENLVTSCWPCNFSKGSDTLDELGLSDPRDRPPIMDDWDGLTRLLAKPRPRLAPSNVREPAARLGRRSGRSHAEWIATFEQTRPGAASRLIEFANGCADLGVEWSLVDVLLLKVRFGGEILNVVAVNADGTCEIPWSIGGAKKAYRRFAEILAEGIPNAVAYETPKTWTVRAKGKRIDIVELLDAAPALRAAIEALQPELLPVA